MMLARPIRVKATVKQGQYLRATHLGWPHGQTSTFVVLTGLGVGHTIPSGRLFSFLLKLASIVAAVPSRLV